VNTARSTFARIGVGVFSAVLGAVLLVMIGALFIASQTLSLSGRSAAETDANDATLAVQLLITGRLEALASARSGLLSAPGSSLRAELAAVTKTFATQPGTHRLWFADSAGATLFDTVVAVESSLPPVASGIAAINRSVADRHQGMVLFIKGGGSRELLLAAPFVREGRVLGVSGAAYDPTVFFRQLTGRQGGGSRYTILSGDDTVASSPAHSGLAWSEPIQRTVFLPGGASLLLVVRREVDPGKIRIALWALGLLAVVFLGAGVIRERRQAIRVSERSAELERLSTELLRANRMKSEFLANVSHELRTPLNAIVGFVDLLREGVYGELSPRQVPPVDRIAASATHLRHLVDQVLDIAKMAAGRLEVHPEVIALRPFVLNVVSELESLIAERDLTLSIAVGVSLPRVRTDPGHLRQILVNLIGNAVKYTPAGGVAVRARLVNATRAGERRTPAEDAALAARAPEAGRPWIALQVIDTGIGIATADQERIFDEFEQVNAGPRGESMQRGTGLGLAISRRLARLLGGDLTVESQLAKGSTFSVWLPVHTGDLDAPVEVHTGAVAQPLERPRAAAEG
jgi:signal transduction histidine kinase